MTQDRHLKPTNDVAFKRIFGNEKHPAILIRFLNDLLGKQPGERILSLEFINPNLAAEYASDKLSIVDVLVCDEKGTRYIVEVQVNAYPGFKKRAQFYASKAYCGQAKVSDQYKDLKAVVFLAIVDFHLFDEKENRKNRHISRHGILDKETHESQLEDLSFTFVELKKFNKTFEELETDEDRWCYFLKNANKDELMEKLVKTSDPIFKKAYSELDKHYWTDREVNSYEQEEKRLIDEFNVLMGAHDTIAQAKKMVEEAEQKVAESEQKAVQAEQKAVQAEQKVAESEQKVAESEQKVAESEQKVAESEQKAAESEQKAVQAQKEAAQTAAIAMAKAALAEGLGEALIAKLTGLSVEEIRRLSS